MKFTFKLTYFLAGFIISLSVGYGFFIHNGGDSEDVLSPTSSQKIVVDVGDIKKSIEVIGQAELVDEQKLTFNKVGTVTAVYYSAGDTVKKGDVIAKIDDSDAYDDIENAKISLENAQISLNQLYDEVDESRVIQAENAIITAQSNLNNAKVDFENIKISQQNTLSKMLQDIETSQKELETLIKEEEDTIENKDISKHADIIQIENSFKSYLAEIEEIIEESDYILGVSDENKRKNDDFEDYLGVQNTTIRNEAKNRLLESMAQYKLLVESVDMYDRSGEVEKIEEILNEYVEIFSTLYEATDALYKTAENSIMSLGSLTQSQIDTMKSAMSSYRSKSLSNLNNVKKSVADLYALSDIDLLGDSSEITIEKKKLSIENAVKEYDETFADYTLRIEELEQDIENKKVNLEVTELNLKELLEGPTNDNVTKAQNNIQQAEIKLTSTYDALEDYVLTAPFDGVVRKIDYMVGDNLKDDNDKYIYIENPNILEVSVNLDQIDIVKVQQNQAALIIFDAYPTIEVQAKISSIDTTANQSSGVVSYEVKLVLDDESFDKKILSGFTANVEILTENLSDILVLKSSVISERSGKKYVTLLKDGKPTQREIETGVSANGYTHILSGLEQGDEIMERTSASTDEGTQTAPTTLFSVPTGRPGGR